MQEDRKTVPDINPESSMRLSIAAAAFSIIAFAQGAAAQADPVMTSSSTTSTTSAMTPQASPSSPGNAAVKGTHENVGPLSAGADSFTKRQAKEHIQHSGYTRVTELVKDANGVWHGKAMKGGQSVNVALDFKGNVVSN
jgi:hypothetical protein